jgi:hypothetical protein
VVQEGESVSPMTKTSKIKYLKLFFKISIVNDNRKEIGRNSHSVI